MPYVRRVKTRPRLALLVAVLVAGGCAGPAATDSPEPSAAPGATGLGPGPSATARPQATAQPAPTSSCIPGDGETAVTVPSKSNIFAAGHAEPTDPGGGGAGRLPPEVELPAGVPAISFPCVDGTINCCVNSQNAGSAGPAGDPRWSTDIPASDGISGMLHGSLGVFLVGVFLGAAEPADPAPERLDFTELCPAPGDTCTFTRLEPELAQLFYVGSGGPDREYLVPAGATRLFLGIADAALTTGPHGYYANNSGTFTAVVAFR